MPQLTQIKILPYSAHQIFNLVMDIEKYPAFLPWCKQARIINIISEENLQADLLINFKGFFEKYRSNVIHFKDENGVFIIETTAIEGPFKKLFSKWKIKAMNEKYCEVEFFIEFTFNSFLLEKMIGTIFEKATHKMIQSFENRALELYSITTSH